MVLLRGICGLDPLDQKSWLRRKRLLVLRLAVQNFDYPNAYYLKHQYVLSEHDLNEKIRA